MSNILILSFVFMCSFLVQKNQADYQDKKFKYLALGDSYTIGESVTESERFPVQLAEKLRSRGIPLEDPVIIAKTGWTIDELQEGIRKANPSDEFDMVTLLIGVNNQYRGRDLDIFRKEFRLLLDQAIIFARGDKNRVIVLSIPDYGVTPFGMEKGQKRISEEIDKFNKASMDICMDAGINYINITQISRKAENDNSLIAEDGLHPSGEMYGLWVEELFMVALAVLMQ